MKLFKNLFITIVAFIASFYFGNKKVEADIPSISVAGATTRTTSNGSSIVEQNTVFYRADGSVSVITYRYSAGVLISTNMSTALTSEQSAALSSVSPNGTYDAGGVSINLSMTNPSDANWSQSTT